MPRHLLPVGVVLLCAFSAAWGQAPAILTVNQVTIPRIDKAPGLEVFAEMKPSPEWESKLAKVGQFTQRAPHDGQPAINQTVVYLAYDDKFFYSYWVCFDSQPGSVRSRLARRDNIGPEDDEIQVYLDTFNDRQRSYGFMTNPRGVQFDYIWTEDNGYDVTFDTEWHSEGRQTDKGWIAKIAVPFKSMRFPKAESQQWGLLLQRVIPRTSENLFWPHVTTKRPGRLIQEGSMAGLANISPGRNLQLIPYGVMRSFRSPDLRDPSNPQFGGAHLAGTLGLDAKAVVKDSFVLDATINPDFSQVESDEPQVTVNQRFAVYFPEKRPFFLENANYFSTPLTMLFTRNIVNPTVGFRLTGKKGPWQAGLLFADDRSPGKIVPDNDPLHNTRAWFGVGRVSRDLPNSGHIGFMYTERSCEGSYNRVGGFDGRLKFAKNWTLDWQAITSRNKELSGATKAGPAYWAIFGYSGRQFYANTLYQDIGQGFLTKTGFFVRPGIRWSSHDIGYNFRPEKHGLLSHGPELYQRSIWDRSGLRLTEFQNVHWEFDFIRSTGFGVFVNGGHERLRPQDFSVLTSNQDYRYGHRGVYFFTQYLKQLSLNGEIGWGTDLNYVTAPGQPPAVGRNNYASIFMTVKPIAPLTIDNTYFFTRYVDPVSGHSSFNNHIIRSKWNYQFNRELSARFIAQYNSTLANPAYSLLSTNKGLNFDFLITWLLHPGTAVYVGYNSNLSNPTPVFKGLGTPPDQFVNGSKGLFVKASYLFRF